MHCMRWLSGVATMLLIGGIARAAEMPPDVWDVWRRLPVLDNGRVKPLDTAAGESLQRIHGRRSVADPKTGRKLAAVAWYVTTLMESGGLDGAASPPAGPRDAAARRPDRWGSAPLLPVGSPQLREILRLPPGENYISPQALSKAQVNVDSPDFYGTLRFVEWTPLLARRARDKDKTALPLTPLEGAALRLGESYEEYGAHRRGDDVLVAPILSDEKQNWWSVGQLVRESWSDTNDPGGLLRRARGQFLAARAAFHEGSAERFREASQGMVAALRQAGPTLGEYPADRLIDLEVGYNRYAPFRLAWGFLVAAALALLFETGTRRRVFYLPAWACFVAGLLAMLAGFWMRIEITGRAPVANMYESVVYLALGVTVFGMIFETLNRRRYVMAAAAAIAAVALVLADSAPAVLDPQLHPLKAELRDNFWLTVHVLTVTLSYAAFALAMGVGNITLWRYMTGAKDRPAVDAQSRFTYRAIQAGVLLLAVGTILGAVWADFAWGRFWGWDPKEVWALVSLIYYLAVLHARHIGWVKQLGLAAASAGGFLCILIAWYGANYWFAGLHSYGAGPAGGNAYVIAGMLLQAVYIAVAAVRGSEIAADTRALD